MSAASDPTPAAHRPVSVWRYARAIVPALFFWIGLVAGAAFLLYDRTRWSERYDHAVLREWFEEGRPFRKNLGELIDDYAQEASRPGRADGDSLRRREVEDQLDAMMEPLLTYRNLLPLFLEIYSIRIQFPGRPDLAAVEWRSPYRPLRAQQDSQVRALDVLSLQTRQGVAAVVNCEYRMHAYHKAQHEEAERQKLVWAVGGVVLGGSVLAFVWVYLFLRRERRREVAELEAAQALEHAERVTLDGQLRAEKAERDRQELQRHVLEQRLESSRQEARAAEAEKAAAELRSQFHANISIMAGSYAHNIKNLLVRPNDLLARCLEADGLPPDQATMIEEIRGTLGTVTQRLQEILRTVRRDPRQAVSTPIDLNELLHSAERTWAALASEKWKLNMRVETAPRPLVIRGDVSHLHQAVENLLFNARDATFEMRSLVRKAARAVEDPQRRREALIEAAAWSGTVVLRAWREGDFACLEVRDNGIGMTPEVLRRCTETHFTTKRNNAIFEGFSAGMGLGLAFVAMVIENHGATMSIESQPEQGAAFRIRFPLADSKDPVT